jgi:hypothetical protein
MPSIQNEALEENGWTALYVASWKNHPSIVSYLLEQEDIAVNKSNKVI